MRSAAAKWSSWMPPAKALDRRPEVWEVVSASANADAAHRELIQLLDVTDMGATAAPDLEIRRYTRKEARRSAPNGMTCWALLESR